MQAQETILFIAVAALAAALVVVVVAPRLRGSGPREAAPPAKPAAQPLAPAEAPMRRSRSGAVSALGMEAAAVGVPAVPALAAPPPPPLVHMICPTCRRQFAAGVRYCPYDARVLTADLHQPGKPDPAAASAANAGKICPSCARRYDTVALVCGRDGTALVSVN